MDEIQRKRIAEAVRAINLLISYIEAIQDEEIERYGDLSGSKATNELLNAIQGLDNARDALELIK